MNHQNQTVKLVKIFFLFYFLFASCSSRAKSDSTSQATAHPTFNFAQLKTDSYTRWRQENSKEPDAELIQKLLEKPAFTLKKASRPRSLLTIKETRARLKAKDWNLAENVTAQRLIDAIKGLPSSDRLQLANELTSNTNCYAATLYMSFSAVNEISFPQKEAVHSSKQLLKKIYLSLINYLLA